MARGIVIPLSANPRDLIRGLKISEDAVEDLAKEFDKVERSADDVSDEFRDLGRNADRSFDKARRSADRLEDELGEVEDEANQSAKEFGASFRGDPVEALEEVQSYLSEIVSSKIGLKGFAGAVAAIGAGAALGLVVAGVEKWRERQERVTELATDYLQTTQQTADAVASVNDALLAQQFLEEQTVDTRIDIARLAIQRKETEEELVRKILSGEVRINDELARIENRRAEIADEILEITKDNNTENDHLIRTLQAEDRVLQDAGQSARDLRDEFGESAEAASRVRESVDLTNQALYIANSQADRLRDKLDLAARTRTANIIIRETRQSAAGSGAGGLLP